MRMDDNTSRRADVVARFDHQSDADEAVLQLRLAGFRDHQIGYFGCLLFGGVTNLLDRNYWLPGTVIGAVMGSCFGIAVVPLLVWLMAPDTGPRDLYGLSITCAVTGALFVGSVGGWLGMSRARLRVDVPMSAVADGPFVLGVLAGGKQDQAWAIIHRYGGHELAPTGSTANPRDIETSRPVGLQAVVDKPVASLI